MTSIETRTKWVDNQGPCPDGREARLNWRSEAMRNFTFSVDLQKKGSDTNLLSVQYCTWHQTREGKWKWVDVNLLLNFKIDTWGKVGKKQFRENSKFRGQDTDYWVPQLWNGEQHTPGTWEKPLLRDYVAHQLTFTQELRGTCAS